MNKKQLEVEVIKIKKTLAKKCCINIKPKDRKPKRKSLEDLLEIWSVIPYMDESFSGKDWPEGWFAVCNDDGIVAYFGKEEDAFRYRLVEINRILNG